MHDRRAAVCYGLVYILCTQVLSTNSRTSTLWKLNTEEGKIVSVSSSGANCKLQSSGGKDTANMDTAGEGVFVPVTNNVEELLDPYNPEEDEESTFHIITTTAANYRDNTWSRQAREVIVKLPKAASDSTSSASMKGTSASAESDVLDCGKPVNFTYYDDLIGVAQRYSHPNVPEPEVAYLFLKKKGPKSLKNFDIDALERRLRKAKSEKQPSVQLYNQIGNFWRIKGDARHSIECFRGALAMAPTNAEVLLNLARVLFNLQDRSAWRQYFTLGEIFKAYGHFQESVNHLRQALELYPQYEPIKKAIADVENISASSLHIFTIIIIIFLVMCVLYVILSSNESNQNSHELEQKSTRHFNRAMAMRSLKGFTQRSFKNRK
uniref:Tetratricopeptide repeat protein 17 n=1 Tax=Anopheles minimus TaxID=112268 RepID=A0A182W4I1_9DIPT